MHEAVHRRATAAQCGASTEAQRVLCRQPRRTSGNWPPAGFEALSGPVRLELTAW